MATLTNSVVLPTYTVTVSTVEAGDTIIRRLLQDHHGEHALDDLETALSMFHGSRRVRIEQQPPVSWYRVFLVVLDEEQTVPVVVTAPSDVDVPGDTRAWLEAVD